MPQRTSEVALVACADYEQEHADAAVREALDLLGGIGRFVKPGDRVLLKINLLANTAPDAAVTTHPAIVRAVIRQVRAAEGVPVVGDCGGTEGPPSEARFRAACAVAGITQVCEAEDAELVHLSARSVQIHNPEGLAFKRFEIAEEVMRADVVINLPKLKTHGLCLFTGGVKNIFGCLPGLTKMQMHARAQDADTFSQMLVDLMLAVSPALTIMDAVVGMDGNGPRSGDPKEIGAILASSDPVALDAVACEMVGIKPFLVATTRLAHERGVGIGDLERIEVRGESLEAMAVADFRLPPGPSGFLQAKGALQFLKRRLVAKPVVMVDRCKACWTCVRHCPVQALSEKGQAPIIDYDTCIRCYCCQELCPSDAIDLKRPLLARFIR
jgi:uncharacterized protein (DUF362 family)/Pyruvate/2-oxoacid:ferredoxin oxidoreductase delta subunit